MAPAPAAVMAHPSVRRIMSPPTRHSLQSHFFTVHVEDYLHVNAFESGVSRCEWDRGPVRLSHGMPLLLEALARHGARASLFVLGWVAKRQPDIGRAIVREGHEVASHGFWHQRLTTFTPEAFC